MEVMGLQEEWITTILGTSTRKGYERGMKLFLEYTGMKIEDLKDIQKPEGVVIRFFDWLKTKKGLCANSARARVVPVQSFYNYIGKPLRLRNKLPKIHARIERWIPSLENLQKMFSLSGLQEKCWITLSRDCPMRLGDLLRITPEQIEMGQWQVLSEKEKVEGVAYVSEQTQELWKNLEHANQKVPSSKRGIDKLWIRVSQITGLPKMHQHLWRKLFISQAISQGISEVIWKILTQKTVPDSDRTYWLNNIELKEYWMRIVQGIPLVAKINGNGQHKKMVEEIDFISKVVAKVIRELRGEQYQTPSIGIGLAISKSDKELLEEYLKEGEHE